MSGTIGALYLAGILFGLILAVAWIVMPFAIIGTKPLLRTLIHEVQEQNKLLASLNGAQGSHQATAKQK